MYSIGRRNQDAEMVLYKLHRKSFCILQFQFFLVTEQAFSPARHDTIFR